MCVCVRVWLGVCARCQFNQMLHTSMDSDSEGCRARVCVCERERDVCVCVIGECVKVCACEGNVCVPVRMQMLPHRGTKTLLPTATTITVH